ncbi:Undecaprenyl-phosphate mannosyltransferase [Phycisphaerae bacterium RAS1]|nr:Undecaprenyl-phosphate mannosyltransferase [Phycisphaerae bacterium RAS1]
MYREKSVCIVIPAYNEEVLIVRTVTTIPHFVDHVVVVDDCSKDRTPDVVRELAAKDPRVHLIRHEVNRGVGGAIATGYTWCRENDVDIAVVMAGDGQMDPLDLPALLDPVVEDRADYSKGNRLVTGEAWKKIPRVRYLGNSALTFLTKIASGYWHVTDSQTGYTALSKKALRLLPLEEIFPRYGMPNDFLVTLNIYNMRVADVPVNPIYNIGEKSGIKPIRFIPRLALLILRLFVKRMVQKYIIRDFHPLVLFYLFGLFSLLLDVPLFILFIWRWIAHGNVPEITALAIAFVTLLGFQSILFAMLFDMEANRDLKGKG